MKLWESISLLLILQFIISISHQACIHDSLEIHLEEFKIEEIDPENASNHRMLSTSLGPLRIKADFTYFVGPEPVKTYIETKLLPATFDYLSAALKVPQLSTLKIPQGTTTICNLTVPSLYTTKGVDADLVLFITGETTSNAWVAWARACSLLDHSGRPFIGQVNFNLNGLIPATDVEYEKDVMSTMHEITHVLGVSKTLFPKFAIKPIIGTTLVNNVSVKYLDLPPLTRRLREYFDCPSLKGAYLENNGGNGTVGSHFERRIFMNEYMTASGSQDMRITEFTLALLEGSGWYSVDYSMVEPIFWGKGRGCEFLDSSCVKKSIHKASFPEFCDEIATRGCNFHRTHGGFCGATVKKTSISLTASLDYLGNKRVVLDQFADNCPYFESYNNINCLDPEDRHRRLLPVEKYGPESRCFSGTLYPSATLKARNSYCFEYKCELQDDGNYFLRILLGKKSVICTSEKKISVDGMHGSLDCPEPNVFCQGVGKPYCRKGCMGRGLAKLMELAYVKEGFQGLVV